VTHWLFYYCAFFLHLPFYINEKIPWINARRILSCGISTLEPWLICKSARAETLPRSIQSGGEINGQGCTRGPTTWDHRKPVTREPFAITADPFVVLDVSVFPLFFCRMEQSSSPSVCVFPRVPILGSHQMFCVLHDMSQLPDPVVQCAGISFTCVIFHTGCAWGPYYG